jgi:2'-5' RNA ligase
VTAPLLESGLVVLAPPAEPLVKAYRDEHDPAAALGVPAHLTVLYPFHPPGVPAAVVERLSALFAEFEPFDYALAQLRRFPGVLYLAPEPEAPFRLLTRRVAEAFPDFPPYGGRFSDVIPHLTLAQQGDAERLERVAAHFQAACGQRLPLHLRAESVALLDNERGAWRVCAAFPLGARA